MLFQKVIAVLLEHTKQDIITQITFQFLKYSLQAKLSNICIDILDPRGLMGLKELDSIMPFHTNFYQ